MVKVKVKVKVKIKVKIKIKATRNKEEIWHLGESKKFGTLEKNQLAKVYMIMIKIKMQ
jgi:hypothetical protein